MRLVATGAGLCLGFLSLIATTVAQNAGDATRPQADARLLLRYATFDPLLATPPVPENLRAAVDTNLWIVQFRQSPTDADRAALRELGGVVRGFLPNDSHVVLLTPGTAAAVQALPSVRWVGAYHPAYRLEEFLRAELASGRSLPPRRYDLVMADKRADKKVLEARILGIGGRVFDRHPGGLLFTADLTEAQLLAAARFDEVLWIDRWSAPEADMDNARIQGGANTIEAAGGYTGSGIRGHVYEGCEAAHPDFTPAMTNVRSGGETQRHGHCTTGIVFGDGVSAASARGMAPDAIGFYTNYTTVIAGWSRNMVIDDVVNVHNCMFTTASWGGAQTPSYTATSANADDIVFDHRIPWTNSMSNLGNQNARPEAWAKNVISVGGVQHYNNAVAGDDSWLAGNGSIGPAADGRIKPDLCAYYDSVWTSDLSAGQPNNDPLAPGTFGGYNGAAGLAGQSYTGFGGTSSATPIVAGHNALAIQMYTDHIFSNPPRVVGGTRFQNRPYAQTLKALMIVGANQYAMTAADNRREHVGWGFPSLGNLWNRSDRFMVVPEDQPITQSGTHTYEVNVLAGETDLKVCMSYLDPAGNPAAALARINDLTLRVISPGGVSYWGNVGLSGAGQSRWSAAGGAANTIDTVECVMLLNPAAGTWTIEITAPTLTTDAHLATAATDATYALVVNGGTRLYGSGCARYIPDASATGAISNYYPFGAYTPASLSTLFTGNASLVAGGTVYFDLTVNSDTWIRGLDVNSTAAAGTELLLDVYRTAIGGTHVGNEGNAAAWTPLTAGRGTAAGIDVASSIDLAQPFLLAAGTYGIAVRAKDWGHRYTIGTGANQNYANASVAIATGSSAAGAPGTAGAVFTPRVANMTLRYQLEGSQGNNVRYQTIVRREELGVAGVIRGLAFAADNSGRHWNSALQIRLSHVPAGYTLVANFAANLPLPTTVLDAANYSWQTAADNWREIGLQNAFVYNGAADVVIDIVARGNHHPIPGAFHRGTEPRVHAATWSGASPALGAVDNAALRMRVSFNCAHANEQGSSCGRLRASHSGDGHRGSTFHFRVTNAIPNSYAIAVLGNTNGAPLPLSMTPFGWTNCLLLNDPLLTPNVLVNGLGVGDQPLVIPNLAALDGAIFYGQWVQLDASEPGGLSFSDHTRVIVGLTP